jgi:hypothetical protein
MFRDDPHSLGIPYQVDPRSQEIARDLGSVLEEIRRRFTEEPGRHLYWYLCGKPLMFWQWDIIAGMGDAFVYPAVRSPYFSADGPFDETHRIMKEIHGGILMLALVGAIVSWLPVSRIFASDGALRAARLVSAVLLYFTVLHMIVAPFPRYSVPLRPLLYGIAVFALWWGWQVVRRRLRAA